MSGLGGLEHRQPARRRTWGSVGGGVQDALPPSSSREDLAESASGSPQSIQPDRPYSPLSAAMAGRRSAAISPLPDNAQDQQQAGLPPIRMRQPELQQQPFQPQQPAGVKFVSLTSNAVVKSPRSPSRLSYSYSSISPGQRVQPVLPKFITVEQTSLGASEDDVQIQHVEGDEEKRQEEVQDKIIKQVDGLVEKLYHHDQLHISALEQELARTDLELHEKNQLIQQLQQQQGVINTGLVHPDSYYNDGIWAAVKRSWRRQCCCWLAILFILVAIILAIAIPVKMASHRKAQRDPPAFSIQPELVFVSNSSMDIRVAVNEAAAVFYVLVPRNNPDSSQRSLKAAATSLEPLAVYNAASGWGLTTLEGTAAACGSIYLPTPNGNTTFSVSSQSSSECTQQHTLAASGSPTPSCARCPLLQPATAYDVWLVVAAGDQLSGIAYLQASTLPSWASSAPSLSVGARALAASSSALAAGVAGFSEASINISFAMKTPGRLKFLVLYANMHARFADRYVVFEILVSDPTSMLYAPRDRFQDGVVARGQIVIEQAQRTYNCSIGGRSSSTCICSPNANCSQEIGCFDGLCDYSAMSLAPNTTYKVLLVPVSVDGQDLGQPSLLAPVTTGPSVTPPMPSKDMAVNPLIGPDRFTIQKVQQDKPGYAYILVTQPNNQGIIQIRAGSATPFQRPLAPQLTPVRHLLAVSEGSTLPQAGAATGTGTEQSALVPSRHLFAACDNATSPAQAEADSAIEQQALPTASRQLIATSANASCLTAGPEIGTQLPAASRRLLAAVDDLSFLPAEAGADKEGSLFVPPCKQSQPCVLPAALGNFVNTAVETLVFQKCVPLAKLSKQAEVTISPLANNTIYRVLVVPVDLSGNYDIWSALVRTQDLTPPILIVVDTPPPDFNKFTVVLQLNEPGTVYSALLLSSDQASVTATVACRPTFQGPVLAETETAVPDSTRTISLTFDQGLTANTDYVLKLIATDENGNCQQQFTDLQIHTLDNIPPQTLAIDVVNIGGTYGGLVMTLDEPGVVYYIVLPAAGAISCPTVGQLFAGTVPPRAALPSPSCLGNFSVLKANTATVQNITGLSSETAYRACAVAMDATKLQNKQAAASFKTFQTLDVTQPALSVSVIPGSDANFSCSRSSLLCSLNFNASLNEPGDILWAVLPSVSLTATLPKPQQLFAASNLSDVLPGWLNAGTIQTAAANITVQRLPSETPYALLLAARDEAPQANYLANLTVLQLLAPDITPPVFTDFSADSVADTQMAINVTLNEASTVFFVVAVSPSSMPTPQQVSVGKAANSAPPAAAGQIAASGNTATVLSASNLTAGTFYDVYLVAADSPAGNMQQRVTNITGVRTTDGTPPVILSLSATFTPPMTFTLTASVSKAGSILYAPRKVGHPAPTEQNVITAVASTDTSLANFTGEMPVAAANAVVSQSACVADGDQLVVYAVAQDNEGKWPGRKNNTSVLESATVQLVAPNFGASCIPQVFLSPLQPSLTLASTGSAAVAAAVPGFMMGPTKRSSTALGTTWQQDVAAYTVSAAAQPVQLIARAGAVQLPGAIDLSLQPLPPASVALIIHRPTLMPDANAVEGSTLFFSYQLADSLGRTQIDMANLTVRPMLSYAAGAIAPAGTAAANNALPDCDLGRLGRSSGVGQCTVRMARRFFPAVGTLAAKVVLRVITRGNMGATSAAADIQLQAPPATLAFAPSVPGVLITLPYRPVYYGETIKVSIEAVNPLRDCITGFVIPLRYNQQRLKFKRAQVSGLWLSVDVNTQAAGGSDEVTELSVVGRAGGNADTAYRSSSSIPLVEVFFMVTVNSYGTFSSAITVNAPPGPFAISPKWSNPFYQFNNFNGQGATGALQIAAVATLGMWAWSDAYDIFNTAVLTAQRVSTTVRGVLVKSFGAMNTDMGDLVQSCTSSNTAAATTAVVDSVCLVHVDAVNVLPAKDLAVTVSVIARTQPRGQSAQVSVRVWIPSNYKLTAADLTLNSVLPINAAPTSTSCIDAYQSTQLTLTADWTNGGNGVADMLAAADVTHLAKFKSSNSNVAQVSGARVKGVQPGEVQITTSANSALKLRITVSSEPICLLQLHALATTGAGLSAATSDALMTNPMRAGSSRAIEWVANQDMVWEDSSAVVSTYASFSDGTVMDVSERAAVTAVLPPGAGVQQLPYVLATDNTTQLAAITVNTTVGTNNTCQQSLLSSWSVCSVPLGSGLGTVRIQLPNPATISSLAAVPTTITSASDPASLEPINLATSSKLSVFVSFSDESVRDFSNDPRTSYNVTTGAALCQVIAAPGGGSQVVATGPSAFGTCAVSATVTFQNNAPLTAVTSVLVVGMTGLAVAPLGVNTISLPQPVPAGSLLATDALTLLKCDARNYDQRTVWTLGLLSNCSADDSCPMVDLNNQAYLTLNSSDTSVAQVLTGFPPPNDNYPSYGLLGNRLVPFTAGNTTITSTFSTRSRSIAVTIKDTYQPTWPTAAALNDTSVLITANMSEAYTVVYQLVPGSQLNLAADPPLAVKINRAGVSLVADMTQGPSFYSATANNLAPGTNYTLLAAVRRDLVLSPGVTVLAGVLVPDTMPPSFTKSAALAVTANAAGDKFTVKMHVGINEQGGVYYAIYGDPGCITGDPTPAEVMAGVNLADVGKCTCSSKYCAAATSGKLLLNGTVTNDTVSLTAALPPFPFDDLRMEPFCSNYTPTLFASTKHAIYLVAEDNLPTYNGWTSNCSMPVVDQTTPPTPCAPLTVGLCINTPPAAEVVNRQALPYATVDLYANNAPTAPAGRPIKSVVTVVDPVKAAFRSASIISTNASLVFTFQISKPGLVQWRLVEQVKIEIANGYLAVADSSQELSISISRKCTGEQLVPSTSYALWYNMTDIYGTSIPHAIMEITL